MTEWDRDNMVDNEPSVLRLTFSHWMAVLVALVLVLGVGSRVLTRPSAFERADYRMGSAQAEDYWLFAQYSRWAVEHADCLVVGDSAIRGYYVADDQTLSHYLNFGVEGVRFANLGVDGLHPAAMAGLLRYYGKAIRRKPVLLHLNPLWMSSPQQDLQTQKETSFHHARLTPQVSGSVACYRASFNERASAVMARYIGPMSFAAHVKIARYGGLDLARWTLEHPYACPIRGQESSNQPIESEQRKAWHEMGVTRRDVPFVDIASSVQWRFFKEVVALLRARGNTLFVVVGPFNEHLLEGESVACYAGMKEAFVRWLEAEGIAFHVAQPLPSDFYRDASHPLEEGYSLMAARLLAGEGFTAFLSLPTTGRFADPLRPD